MQERYRNDYDGEFVILNTYYKDGKKVQDREWITNPIENQYISARAAVIGAGPSRENFDIKKIENHKGGLLGKKSLQTYGSQGCWRDLRCDFYVGTDKQELEETIEAGYVEKSVVYTGVKNCIAYPGEFYLVPYNVKLHSTATAAYIAAFDGHKEIFLLGVDTVDSDNVVINKLFDDINKVIDAYANSTFVFVTDWQPHNELRKNKNVQFMNYRSFVSHCDV